MHAYDYTRHWPPRTLRVLLDEMHSPMVADAPRAEVAQQHVVVTENIVDCAGIAGTWATERRSHAGLIFTSPKRFNRADLAYPATSS